MNRPLSKLSVLLGHRIESRYEYLEIAQELLLFPEFEASSIDDLHTEVLEALATQSQINRQKRMRLSFIQERTYKIPIVQQRILRSHVVAKYDCQQPIIRPEISECSFFVWSPARGADDSPLGALEHTPFMSYRQVRCADFRQLRSFTR